MLARRHRLCRRLGDEKAAIGGDGQSVGDGVPIQLGDRPAQPGAGIIDHDLGWAAERRGHRREQRVHLLRPRDIAGMGDGADFGLQSLQLIDIPRSQGDLHSGTREGLRNRCAQPVTRTHDQSIAIIRRHFLTSHAWDHPAHSRSQARRRHSGIKPPVRASARNHRVPLRMLRRLNAKRPAADIKRGPSRRKNRRRD
jgi:hypothetical protein